MSRNLCTSMWCKGTTAPETVSVNGRTVTARALSFEGDVQKGAFKRSIRETGPRGADRIWHLDNNDIDRRIGKPSRLWEASDGLYFRTTIPKTRLGNDVMELYRAGALTHHSAGYVPKERDARGNITDAELYFVSTDTGEAKQKSAPTCSCQNEKTAGAVIRRLERKLNRIDI